jgi:hypothetical protein
LDTTFKEHGSSPLAPPLRIVVLGNSQALVVAAFERPGVRGTYAQLLEQRLIGRGVNATVINEARWWDLIHKLRPRLVPSVACHSPGVTVLGYGMGECEPNIPPTFVMRRLDDARWTPSFNPVATGLRKLLLRPLERFRKWTYRRIVPLLGMRTWRLRPSRFEAELTRTIEWTRRQTGGLVIVLTLHDPGASLERLLPGFRERAGRFNTIIRSVVARINSPYVRVVEAGAELDRIGATSATLDGLHYTPAGHETLALLLEGAITDWMATTAKGESTWAPT